MKKKAGTKSRNSRYFCDTTIAYYRLHGHSLQRIESERITSESKVVISNYVRGEYIRGYVYGLLLLWFTIKAEDSVEDGMLVFTSRYSNHPRRITNALNSTIRWLGRHEDWQDAGRSLRRLGDCIRECVYRFDEAFPHRSYDGTACEFGVINFAFDTYTEDAIVDFYQRFSSLYENPDCKQCDFRRRVRERLETEQIDLFGNQQKVRFSKHKGYVKQAEWLDKANRSTKSAPTCWYCERLGDSVIALSAPAKATILTGDKQSFLALGQILGVEVQIVPSLKELKANREELSG